MEYSFHICFEHVHQKASDEFSVRPISPTSSETKVEILAV